MDTPPLWERRERAERRGTSSRKLTDQCSRREVDGPSARIVGDVSIRTSEARARASASVRAPALTLALTRMSLRSVPSTSIPPLGSASTLMRAAAGRTASRTSQ